jgi:hypothetical protein
VGGGTGTVPGECCLLADGLGLGVGEGVTAGTGRAGRIGRFPDGAEAAVGADPPSAAVSVGEEWGRSETDTSRT